ncbi:MAG: hypothetical protein JJU05_01485 [Verrucomicrobia bacterium]|nr:hypothetical protein [Verrucomicrobiota bacterium]MCH8528273.1 hypothetical protein [Kiritimatiellia bacterium]
MPPANGYDLVCERLKTLPGILRDQLTDPAPPLPADIAERGLVATGAGSSEAAARLLVQTLQRIGIPARFEPLARFYRPLNPLRNPAPYLAVFSQGLSPNAGIPLFHRPAFSGLILFTAATPEGQQHAGKPDRADLLRTLREERAVLWTHPLENEYTLLPRFIGPVCVQLAVCQFCEALSPGCLGGAEALKQIPDLFSTPAPPVDEPEAWLRDLKNGVTFYFTNECAETAQNLAYKCMETFMVRPPGLADALSYAHGRFQRDIAEPAANWIFTTSDPDEQDLVRQLTPLFERGGGYRIIESPLPPPLALFHYEARLNSLCEALLRTEPVDLIDWPGKGEDGPGYHLNQPGPRATGDTT